MGTDNAGSVGTSLGRYSQEVYNIVTRFWRLTIENDLWLAGRSRICGWNPPTELMSVDVSMQCLEA